MRMFAKVRRAGWTVWIILGGALLLVGVGLLGGGANHGAAAVVAGSAPAAMLGPKVTPANVAGTPPVARQPAASGRQVIEQGSVTLEVTHVAHAVAVLTAKTVAAGGYVAASSMNGSGSSAMGNLTLRVPATVFRSFLSGVGRIGHVVGETQSGTDVTGEVNNLAVEIGATRSEIAGYERLYQKASSMSDLLQIEQALTQAEANLLNLEQQAAGIHQAVRLATITVSITPVPVVVASRGVQVGAVFRGSLATMLSVGRLLLAGVVWVAPWAVLAVAVAAVVRWWRRRRPARLLS